MKLSRRLQSKSIFPAGIMTHDRFFFNRGKFGVVFKCLEKSPGRKVSAVKIMSRRRNKASEVEKEVAILKELQHPHLLEFRDFVVDEDSYILVTELYVIINIAMLLIVFTISIATLCHSLHRHTTKSSFDCKSSLVVASLLFSTSTANLFTHSLTCSLGGGELFDYCTEQDYLFENEAVHFLKQILDGLQYMHSKNICHLDLKVKNEKYVKNTSCKLILVKLETRPSHARKQVW